MRGIQKEALQQIERYVDVQNNERGQLRKNKRGQLTLFGVATKRDFCIKQALKTAHGDTQRENEQ